MLIVRPPQLSVIIPSCNPKWLANCLSQYRQQSLGDLKVETIVVVEGDHDDFMPILHHNGIQNAIFKPVEGKWGAYAKDVALEASRGDYVCFWDDDNVYYPHALATLYAASCGFDLGIARTRHMAKWFKTIPQARVVEFGNVDTMCFCVERNLARKAKWADHEGAGTDHAYVAKLLGFDPSIRWIDMAIGEKLLDGMPRHDTLSGS